MEQRAESIEHILHEAEEGKIHLSEGQIHKWVIIYLSSSLAQPSNDRQLNKNNNSDDMQSFANKIGCCRSTLETYWAVLVLYSFVGGTTVQPPLSDIIDS
jgi:hypothetical protein